MRQELLVKDSIAGTKVFFNERSNRIMTVESIAPSEDYPEYCNVKYVGSFGVVTLHKLDTKPSAE